MHLNERDEDQWSKCEDEMEGKISQSKKNREENTYGQNLKHFSQR
jgi:hypothetical protein